MTIPSVDQNICGSWNEQQLNLYNKLPFYLLEAEAKYRKNWVVYKPLLGTVPWKANSGDTMRRVMAEPAPVIRQEAYPAVLASIPNADIYNYRERTADTKLRMQDFASPHFSYLPEFQDFMKHIDRTTMNINRQITIFEDVFYRTMLFHHAPYVYVSGVGIVAAPTGDPSSDGSTGKTNAWLQAQIALLSAANPGTLTFQEIWKALNEFEQTVGATPFEGSGKPAGDSNPLNEKYCLVQDAESWNNFLDDPWLKENRPLNMNIVSEAYKGDLFGRIRCRLERWPIRYKVGLDFVPSQPVPEIVEENPNREDYGRTKPNPPYAQATDSTGNGNCSAVGVCFLMGEQAADAISVGPPPAEFVREMDQGAAIKMNWNGKTYLTKNFLIPCKDANGNTQYTMNEFGRYLRAQGSLALGISMINMQNCLPILYKRRGGVLTTHS